VSRLKLLILDACVVIQLHELGRLQQVIEQCDIHLSEIVARREVKFDDANGTRIDLEPAIQSKAITIFSVDAVKVEAFCSCFDDSYLGVLDDGEAESLAYLFDAKSDFNSTNSFKLCLTVGLSIQAGDGVMHCRRLFSFFPNVFPWFLQGQAHFGPVSARSESRQVETLYPRTRHSSPRARYPKSLDSLVSRTFGLSDFSAPRSLHNSSNI